MTGVILAFAMQETELRIFVLITGPDLTRTILCEVSFVHVGNSTIQCNLCILVHVNNNMDMLLQERIKTGG